MKPSLRRMCWWVSSIHCGAAAWSCSKWSGCCSRGAATSTGSSSVTVAPRLLSRDISCKNILQWSKNICTPHQPGHALPHPALPDAAQHHAHLGHHCGQCISRLCWCLGYRCPVSRQFIWCDDNTETRRPQLRCRANSPHPGPGSDCTDTAHNLCLAFASTFQQSQHIFP